MAGKIRECRNCGALYISFGVFCGDCVRAFVAGVATALGAWVGELLIRIGKG